MTPLATLPHGLTVLRALPLLALLISLIGWTTAPRLVLALLAAAAVAERITPRYRPAPPRAPPPVDEDEQRRQCQGAAIEEALDAGQIGVVFQPIIAAGTGAVLGAETLMRWAHPTRGVIPPDEFITAAEDTGRIALLTRHVLDLALAAAHRWATAGHRLTVAVNISAQCLTDPQLPDIVAAALHRHRVPAKRLTLELTESILIGETAGTTAILTRLHALGVRLSLDDFGTGYAFLALLRQLPIDEIKLDKSFVQGMSSSWAESLIPHSIIELAHNLGLRVVGEGVEDELARQMLVEMGCDKLQGYLISKPLPPVEFEGWLAARAGNRAAA